MAQVEIPRGHPVQIPALQLSSGRSFKGVVRATDGENMVLGVENELVGELPPLSGQQEYDLTWTVDGVQRTCPVHATPKGPRLLVVTVAIKERREAQRLILDLTLTYEVIASDAVSETAEAVLAKLNTYEQPGSEANRLMHAEDDPIQILKGEISTLREAIFDLTRKMESLTLLIESGGAHGGTKIEKPLAVSNCSNTGLGFIGSRPHPEGTYFKMHLRLPMVPMAEIDCVGVVVRCDRTEPLHSGEPEKFDFGVRFSHIHENDRERIIQYMFKMQRRMLRDRKEAREEIAEIDHVRTG